MIRGLRSLYRGDNHFGLIRRSKLWLGISSSAILISVIALLLGPGLNLGIDFKGGSLWVVPITRDVSEGQVREVMASAGVGDANVQFVTESGVRKARVRSQIADPAAVDRAKAGLAGLPGAGEGNVEVTSVGPSWGGQISRKALQALIVFLILITIYISLRFEFKMALAALTALAHDLIITAGVYSLAGFEVVPATVIATLTILGYSLYDTVVVFDKIQENTALLAQQGRQTYADTVNDSLNQVLMRSLNTSLTALIPVGSLLIVGVLNPAGGTLKDFALALFVGLASGTYSSVFFASPILVLLKEREPRYRAVRTRLETRPARATAAASARGSTPPRRVAVGGDAPGFEEPAVEEAVTVPAKKPASRPAAKKKPAGSRPQGKKKPGGKRRR